MEYDETSQNMAEKTEEEQKKIPSIWQEKQKNRPVLPEIFHTCGSEDFLIEKARETRDFFQGMEGNPYHYVYEEHEGIHGWDYWDEHITDFLNYLEKILKK